MNVRSLNLLDTAFVAASSGASREPYEAFNYEVGQDATDGGWGWDGAWTVGALPVAKDNFESYSVGATAAGGGSGWDGDWRVV